ncbi:stalk domain-containing protein, partial [Anaerotignum faecicola]|uniref:stalk domain-containing protein n=1 Tax=Anaerotignum faecicola TaxID=2358141 RepID=UPI003FD8A184
KELLKGISLLMEGENSTAVSGNETADFEGEGTAANPYKIQNVDDLKLLAENVNIGEAYANTYFKLTANIDLNNEPNWTPIGKSGLPFQGTFDGYGYQITNLKISNGGQYAGLFGYTKGAVIKNCNVTGEINGYNHTGGIVGSANVNTKIRNCSFQGNVEGNGEKRGGIVGHTSIGCDVSGCFVTGTVTGEKFVGGIAGWGAGTIKNCYALANVTATGVSAGGIAGYYCSNFTIENCYYSGNVSAKWAGGIAGYVSESISGSTEIKNCVSLAESVTGSNANRIAGYNDNATLTNNYAWSGTTVSGSAASDGADLTYTNGTLSPQFSEIFGSDNSAWKFTKDGLPILKDVGGTQFSELPKCMTGVGFDGFGIKTNPYLIEDVEDLKLLEEKVNSGETYTNKYFKQTADIDLKNEEWTPIGTMLVEEGRPFQGTFDGGGHQITKLKITGGSYAGLFGYTEGAVIKSCNVTGEVNGYNCTGGIVGYATDNTHILNCSFQGNVEGDGEERGGIVGSTSGGCEVSGCFVTGTVTGDREVGGIAGTGVGTIKNCYALANVTATGVNAGGIAGKAYGVTIENCYYSGEVSAKNYAGGIAGYVSGAKTIRNCVSLAESVTGGDLVNRIVGYVGSNANVTLTNNYSYNRTQLVINGKITYADTDNADTAVGKNVFVSAGKLMTDVQKGEVFNWNKNGFTEKNGWSIPNEAYKLPSLHGGEYPDLPNLPSKDLTIDKTPQHFTTRNIGNGFVVKVTSEGTLNESIEFTKEYRLHDTTDEWARAVPNTAGTYDVKITRAADGDINPFACEILEGLVLTKKHSSSSGTTTRTYTAQFDTNGGSAVDKVKTDKNGKIERPADPTKEGYIFVGWYSDSKLTKPFDFSAELTANSTLYAKWKENNEIILTIGSQKISVFGREIKNDVAPKIVNDRTMLPIRIVAESLGGTVTWNGELQRVTIQKGADVILITIGADTAYVNGTAVKLDAAAFVENGRTYLPLRFVSETLGAQVAWNEAEKTVTITK